MIDERKNEIEVKIEIESSKIPQTLALLVVCCPSFERTLPSVYLDVMLGVVGDKQT